MFAVLAAALSVVAQDADVPSRDWRDTDALVSFMPDSRMETPVPMGSWTGRASMTVRCVIMETGQYDACRVIGDILSRVGDKWSMLVVMTLLEGDRHFNELKRAIDGISQQMLSRTLRALERDGLVLRTVHPSVPVRVEYALSALGRSLVPHIQGLAQWAQTNMAEIKAARLKGMAAS